MNELNPYAPVEVVNGPLDDEATEITFRLTKSAMRHGVDHYLLHWHPLRLLLSSLAMIFASAAAFVWSMTRGMITFQATLVITLSVSTVIYLALVHRSKMKIRAKLREHGLITNTSCTVAAEDDEMVLKSSNGEHRWPKKEVQVYRTPRGMILCPDVFLFVYVPRRNNSPKAAYRALREKLQTD